jgi:hypothetical protein
MHIMCPLKILLKQVAIITCHSYRYVDISPMNPPTILYIGRTLHAVTDYIYRIQ